MRYTYKDYLKAGIVLFCLLAVAYVAGEIDRSSRLAPTLDQQIQKVTYPPKRGKVDELAQTLERFRSIPGYDQSTIDYILNKFEDAIKYDLATWEELGTDQAELESLVRQNRVKDLKVTLQRFRNIPGYGQSTSNYIINGFGSAVDSQITTWKELGTDRTELESLARQNRVKDLKVTLQRFRSIPGYGQSTSNYIIDGFKNAVKSDVTTWKELETSQAELEKLARQNRVKDLKITLGMFRSIPGYDSESIRFVIKELRDAVDSNVTTWEELGTDQTELESLARQNKAKEGEM